MSHVAELIVGDIGPSADECDVLVCAAPPMSVIFELSSRSRSHHIGRRIDIEGARRHRRDVPAICEVNFDEGCSFQSGSLQVLPIQCSDFQLSPYDAAAAAAQGRLHCKITAPTAA